MLIEVSTPVGAKQLRTEPRMKVLLAGELRTPIGPVACRLHDISRGGACVDADHPQRVGSHVSLSRGPLAAKGIVVWARGRRCGLQFNDPIRATDLFVQLSASRQSQAGLQPKPQTRSQPVNAPICPFPSR